MKKVCHITTVHPRYDIRIFQKECRFLARAEWDTFLIVNDQMPNEEKDGVHILSTQRQATGRIKRMTQITKVVYKMALEVDADIYHIHDPELLVIAKRLSNKGKRVIFDSHEFTALQIQTKAYLPKIARCLIASVYSLYEKYVLKRIAGVISPCPYDGKDYFETICDKRIYINNYPIVEELETENQPKEKDFQVCYIGSLTEERGLIQMVKAAYMANIKLVLGGVFSPEELHSKIQEMPENECVEYLGQVKHADAMKMVSKSTVGISVLQNEGQYAHLYNLPTKVYEYMALGIPTVISDFPYVKQVLEKYKFGIAVNPADEEEIAKAIKYVSENPDVARQMGIEGKRAIKEMMNWEADSQKLLKFYKEIMESID